MGDLVTLCQQRADKVGDGHLTEWKSLISEVYGADVYGTVAETGLRYFEYVETLTTTGAAYVEEPDDLLSVIRVDYVDSSGNHYELDELNVHEEAYFAGRPAGGRACFFTLIDDRIYLYPTPPTDQTYQLIYIPQPPDLGVYTDGGVVDLVTPDGLSCLLWGVAMLAKAKASQDVTLHLRKHEQHKQKLMEWAAERMLSQPRRRVVQFDGLGGVLDPADYRWSR